MVAKMAQSYVKILDRPVGVIKKQLSPLLGSFRLAIESYSLSVCDAAGFRFYLGTP